MPATEESVEKINQWGLAAAGIWDSAANNPASRVLDDALRAQLAARDAMLRAMPRRDPDNAVCMGYGTEPVISSCQRPFCLVRDTSFITIH